MKTLLKKHLPKRLHRHVSQVRSAERGWKTTFLQQHLAHRSGELFNANDIKDGKVEIPGDLKRLTKKGLILTSPQYAEMWTEISEYMAPEAFYDAAIGKMDFREISTHILHQPLLPIFADLEPVL